MQKSVKSVFTFTMTLIGGAIFLLNCGLIPEDECKDTEAPDIQVTFRVLAYHVDNSIQGAVYNVQSQKQYCDGTVKGQYEIKGLIDDKGTFESYMEVTYNYHNTEDKVLFTYWFNGIGNGTRMISYHEARGYAGAVYYVNLNAPSAEMQHIYELYEQDPTDFQMCQDLPYTIVTGKPKDGGTADKTQLYETMKSSGYVDIEQGVVPEGTGNIPSIDFSDGDIVMFSFNDPPGTENNPKADHYAVVYGGKLYQIINWTQPDKGGQLDGPKPFSFFFNPRDLTNPYTGEQQQGLKPYQYFKVWRKAQQL